MADSELITRPGPLAIPFTYTLGATEVLRPTCAFAHWNGAGASGTFLPCLSYYAQDGTLIMRVFPSTSVAAGGTADVSYAPFPGGMISSGSAAHTTVQVPIPLDTPDASGNAYAGFSINNGFANIRAVRPAFTHALDGTWEGRVAVPQDYASAGTVVLVLTANNTAGSKAARFRVSSAVVAAGSSMDTAYTDEAYVNISVPTSANQAFAQTYTLTTTPVAGATLNVKVTRNGTNGGDTLTTVDVLLFGCYFRYSN